MATLTLGIKESVTIDGTTFSFDTTGSSDDLEITGVNHVFQQTLGILHTGATQVFKIDHAGSPTESAGQIKHTDFKYMRITNNDSSNFVILTIQDATNNLSVNYKLLAGQSMYFDTFNFFCIDASVTLGTVKSATTVSGKIEEVLLQADTAECSCSVFVAYA